MSHKWSSGWIRMIPVHHPDQELNIFTTHMDNNVGCTHADSIMFRVQIDSKMENNCFVDTNWIIDLYSEKQFTDVDVFVGPKKLQVHRVVLSARSPVFKTLLSKISNMGRPTLTNSKNVDDLTTVEHFLKYLYTGTLDFSTSKKTLLALAEMYKVETQMEICQLAIHESNLEDIAASLLALI